MLPILRLFTYPHLIHSFISLFVSLSNLQIYSIPSQSFVCSLIGHMHWVRSAVFSHDGWVVGSGGDDKTVKLWDIRTHKCIQTFIEPNG